MTLTKNSTNYQITDKIGDVNVTGSVSLNEDGNINISINTDNGGHGSFSKNTDGYTNIHCGFTGNNDILDYLQSLIVEVQQELANE